MSLGVFMSNVSLLMLELYCFTIWSYTLYNEVFRFTIKYNLHNDLKRRPLNPKKVFPKAYVIKFIFAIYKGIRKMNKVKDWLICYCKMKNK